MIAYADALAWLAARAARLASEHVPLAASVGRILAAEVPGSEGPATAACDGRAVRAADTEGASDYAPLPIDGVPVAAGTPMPPGTDAVLPLHLIEGAAALAPVPPGNGVQPGFQPGLPAGTRLRPPHLAHLARLGLETVAVVQRPRIALHVAGPKSGPDALTDMLTALVAAEGGTLAGDAPHLHLHAGRSGNGPDDDGAARLEVVYAHGVAMRPGETAAIGTIGRAPAILLPGDPLACATSFALLAAPTLRRMGGGAEPVPVSATLSRKIASGLGQFDAVRARLEDGRATPLGPADSTVLGAGAGADGLVLVAEGSEGYPAGARVLIYPLP